MTISTNRYGATQAMVEEMRKIADSVEKTDGFKRMMAYLKGERSLAETTTSATAAPRRARPSDGGHRSKRGKPG